MELNAAQHHVDPDQLRGNVRGIARKTARPVIAVVKADAYGCGLDVVLPAINDLVEGYYVFSATEAIAGQIWDKTHKPTIALHGNADIHTMIRQHIRPCVWTLEQARTFASLDPVLMVDTGQQRFACLPEMIEPILDETLCREAMTHASTARQVRRFTGMTDGLNLRRHAAGTALLDEPDAWLDAVRPGLAIYDQAVRIRTRLLEAKATTGPAGYSQFSSPHIGVIPVGYALGLRPGSCLINGRLSRVLECGMQSSFIATSPADKVGDDVVLLGDGLSCKDLALQWNCSPQEVLLSLSRVWRGI